MNIVLIHLKVLWYHLQEVESKCWYCEMKENTLLFFHGFVIWKWYCERFVVFSWFCNLKKKSIGIGTVNDFFTNFSQVNASLIYRVISKILQTCFK
jgi:hypothetical protein